MVSHLVALLAPALFLVAAAAAMRGGAARTLPPKLIEVTALGGIAVAILSFAALMAYGAGTSPVLGPLQLGLSVRLDSVSVTMLLLVSFVGWVVLRYAITNLDGERGRTRFLGLICLTLAGVLLLVTAGHVAQLLLGWVVAGLGIRKLLLFYAERPAARRAARKMQVVSTAADVALVGACAALIAAFGTSQIDEMLAQARIGGVPWQAQLGAALLALAAMLKSAQFPAHGWLTEVMEAPTPVSALLHAGVINAGGFLLIRFADVMLTAPLVLATLVMVGGFTALFGSVVMLTQSAVKTSLAWSTIAQMGFMTLQCGLALFPLALLHIVAHSLYKAHAFLSASTAVERIAQFRRPGPAAVPNGGAVVRAFVAALAIYAVIGMVLGLPDKSPQAIALGAILIFGVAYLIAQGLADAAPAALTRRTALMSAAASISYFALQSGAEALTRGTLPATPPAGSLEWALLTLALISFGAVAVAQSLFPLWSGHPAAAGLRVHLVNGLYANAVFDRLTGGWTIRPTKSALKSPRKPPLESKEA